MDADRGRFWTLDGFGGTVRVPSSLHKYMFVIDDPVNLMDPTGESPLVTTVIALEIQASLRKTEAQTKLAVSSRTAFNVTTKLPRQFRLLKTARGYERHHIIEQRLLRSNPNLNRYFGGNPNNMPAVHMQIGEHHAVTARWANALPRKFPGGPVPQYTVEEIMIAAEKVYFDMPAVLSATLRYLASVL